ncbi:NAD(P)-binding domain-containing protein [Thermocatellispora tengchongensis]
MTPEPGFRMKTRGLQVNIAFLGLGRMGRELVVHLIDAGHQVTVWNRTPSAAEGAVKLGAVAADTAPEAVAGAEAVLTVLFGPDAVREVVIAPELPIGDGALWVDITSVGPEDAAAFADWSRKRGIRFAHSPVVGSLAPARAGALGVLLGGEPDAIALARPIVSLWAAQGRPRVYDTAAKAAAAKLVANLALAVSMQGMVEALRLGCSGGLTAEEALAALDGTPLSRIRDIKGEIVREGVYDDTQFSADLLHKDARLMLRLSARPLPALTAAFTALDHACRTGHGDSDFSVIAEPDTMGV